MASSSEIKSRSVARPTWASLREHNEDNFLVVDFAHVEKPSPEISLDFLLGEKGALFLVCDGMGGAAAVKSPPPWPWSPSRRRSAAANR